MTKPTYRRVNREDVAQLQAVMEATPSYFLIVQGSEPAPDEAERELVGRPDGVPLDRKHLFLVQLKNTPVGCLELLEGYPDPSVAFLGLLLIVETHQHQGLGREVLRFAKETGKAWHCTSIRLAVADANSSALRFWKHMGFTEIERRKSTSYAGMVTVLERSLAPHSSPAT